jgi:hypothetical protein
MAAIAATAMAPPRIGAPAVGGAAYGRLVTQCCRRKCSRGARIGQLAEHHPDQTLLKLSPEEQFERRK